MRNALAPLVDAVALFMDNSAEEVREAVRQVRPTPAAVPWRRGRCVLPRLRRALDQGRADGGSAQPSSADRAAAALSRRRGFPVRQPRRRQHAAAAARRSTGRACRRTLDKPVMLAGGLTPGQRLRRDPRDPAVGRRRLQRHRSPRRASRTAIGCAVSSRKSAAPTATSSTPAAGASVRFATLHDRCRRLQPWIDHASISTRIPMPPAISAATAGASSPRR